MVILIIYQFGVTTFKGEGHAPASVNCHGKMPRQIAIQRVKSPAWCIHVICALRTVHHGQHNAQLTGVMRLYASLALSAGSSSYAPSPPGTWPWLAAHHQYQALFSWSSHQAICRFMHKISGAGKGIKFVWGRGNCRFGSSGFRVGNEQRTWPYWQQAPSPL